MFSVNLFSKCFLIVFDQYKRMGCFNDTSVRAMSQKLLGGNRLTTKDKINLCYLDAANAGYTVFAVQLGGKCFSGPSAGHTYRKYGHSASCRDGTGGIWANDVYLIYSK